jgi:hypothetical protein
VEVDLINAPFVAIVACTKSANDKPDHFIEQKLLASIYKAITKEERAWYRVELILGYDHDDEYWRQEFNHYLSPTNNDGSVIFGDHEPIPSTMSRYGKIQLGIFPIVASPSTIYVKQHSTMERPTLCE